MKLLIDGKWQDLDDEDWRQEQYNEAADKGLWMNADELKEYKEMRCKDSNSWGG